MNRRPPVVVNTRMAVKCTILPLDALEERKPDQLMSEVLEVKPIKRRLPGTKLLIKLGKDKRKEKDKRAAAKQKKMLVGVDEKEVADAMSRIMADLT